MRASLRLKLIITFLIISVTGTLLTAWVVQFSNERAFDDLLREQQQADFVEETLAFFESNGSWEDVLQLVNTPKSADPNQSLEKPPPLALADADGRIVLPNRQFQLDTIAQSEA